MKKYIYSLLLCLFFVLTPVSFSGIFNSDIDRDVINSVHAQGVDLSASEESTVTVNSEVPANFESGCGITDPSSYLGGCMTGPLISLSGYILYAAAGTFDFFLQLTLEPQHLRANYIATTWATMRDLANVTFILGIIIIAFFMITGAESQFSGINTKTLATRLIIVALLLNFSLFFAQVVIDAGNITAGVFWNQIKSADLPNSPYSNLLSATPDGGGVAFGGNVVDVQNTPSPSAVIVGSLNLVQSGPEQPGLLSIKTVNTLSDTGNSQGFLFSLNVLIILVTVLVGRSLFVTGFMFLTRTVVLIILMIISPLAFVCYFFPGGTKYWGMWLSHLIAKSFCVVAYLFFIFLLLKILEGTTLGAGTDFATAGSQTTLLFLFIAVNTGIIVVVLNIAKRVSTSMCEGGVTGIGTMIMKTGVGAATLATGGAAGFAARASVGRLGHHWANTSAGKAAEAKTTAGRAIQRLKLYAGEGIEKSSTFGDYRGKLTEQANSRKNVYDKTKNQVSANVSKRIIDDAEISKEKGWLDDAGKLTVEGKKEVSRQADAAADGYIESIAPTIFNKDKKSTFGSVFDTVIAGGVSAGQEAERLVGKEKKVQKDAESKTDKIRNQQLAIGERKAFMDQNTDITANTSLAQLKHLEDVLTSDDQGMVIDERSMNEFKKAFQQTFMQIKEFDASGNPVLEMTEQAQSRADTAWGNFVGRIETISEEGRSDMADLVSKVTESEDLLRSAETNNLISGGLLQKITQSESQGGVDWGKLSDKEQMLVQKINPSLVSGEKVNYNPNIVSDIREYELSTKQEVNTQKGNLQDAKKAKTKRVEDVRKETERAFQAATSVSKQKTRELADTERSTLNARIENITDEKIALQKRVEDGQVITVDLSGPEQNPEDIGRNRSPT